MPQRKPAIHHIAIAFALAASLTACASRPGPAALNTVAAWPSAKQVKVYAVTTRSRVKPDTNIYDAGKSVDTNYAELTVSIPPNHKAPDIELPKNNRPDPRKTFAVVRQSVLDESQLLNQVRAEAQTSHRIAVFVHGYNNNFQEALFRLAQMSADSNVGGSPILFAWPSQGALAGYVADKEAATYSRDYLARLLSDLTKGDSRDQIFVFAHSMGGWLTVEALRQLKLEGRDDVLRRLHVVLAAPDIDADVFRTQMAVIGKMPNPMLVLVSGDDRALAASKFLSASTQRVGSLNVKDPKVEQAALANNVQIIDISSISSLDSTNHNRYVEVASLYPALTAQAQRQGLGSAGAFVFDAAAATISSPFRLVSGALRQTE